MISYLVFLTIPSLIAYFSNQTQRYSTQYWILVFLFLLFLSTFRYEIGSDQGDYNFTFMHYYYHNNTIDLLFDFESSGFPNYELFYSLIELISFKLDLGFQGVNFFCAVIYLTGLFLLIKNEKTSWLCLFLSLPYFYFTVSWGYLRQGVSLGFIFLSIYFYKNNNHFLLFLSLILSILSQKFAIIFAPILLFTLVQKKSLKILLILLGLIVFLGLVYYVSIINTVYLKNFITEVPESYTSKGAILRSGMSFLVAVLFFLSLKIMRQYKDYKLYLYISIICLFLLPMSLIFPIPSTRIGVFFGLIQFIILPRIIDKFDNYQRKLLISLVMGIYVTFYIVWLHYSPQKVLWIPFKFSFQ